MRTRSQGLGSSWLSTPELCAGVLGAKLGETGCVCKPEARQVWLSFIPECMCCWPFKEFRFIKRCCV